MTRTHALDRRPRLARLRPAMEPLEARSLMAYAGGLDTTFGGGLGYKLTKLNPADTLSLTDLSRVAVEQDGSVVEAGPATSSGTKTFGVTHLKADGTPDTSFGTGGTAVIALPGGMVASGGPSVLLPQPDGKVILMAGVSTTATPAASSTLVARFDADGSADSTFGTSGVEVLDQATLGVSAAGFGYAALQPDGKIVLAGGVSAQELAAVRLGQGGALDTTFGTGGLVTFSDIPGSTSSQYSEATEAMAIQPDGKIVILASLYNLSTSSSLPELIRLDADGSRDASLGQSGIISSGAQYGQYGSAGGLIVQPDGKILVLGTTFKDASPYIRPLLSRVNADGTLDKTATLPAAAGPYSIASNLALLPDGEVALAGEFNPSAPTGRAPATIRLTPSLTPDLTFGDQGVSKLTVEPPGAGPTISDTSPFTSIVVAATPDDRLVVAGSNESYFINAPLPATYLHVARLTATGSAHPGDFTGDGVADPAVYLPARGSFAIRPSQGGPDEIVPFGIPGPGQTIPAPGDYTGSGAEEVAAYLPSLGAYAYRPPTGPDVLVRFGIKGAGQTIPAPGDYFGTGRDDLAVYLPSLGAFGLRNPAGGPDRIIPFGSPGAGRSIPVPGDYTGSGKTELAVYLPSRGAYAYRPANGGPDVIVPFGMPGAGNTIPMPGDYDGSGKTELAVYLPSLGEFIYRPAKGGADVVQTFGIAGAGRTLAAQGDYTGSGLTEAGVYLPSLGELAFRRAGGGPDVRFRFGIPGAGQTLPVTVVVPSPSPGPSTASAASVVVPGESAGSGPLDLMAVSPTKKAKPGAASGVAPLLGRP